MRCFWLILGGHVLEKNRGRHFPMTGFVGKSYFFCVYACCGASWVLKTAFPCATCFGYDNPCPLSTPGSPIRAYHLGFLFIVHSNWGQKSDPQSSQSVTHLKARRPRSTTGFHPAFSKHRHPTSLSFHVSRTFHKKRKRWSCREKDTLVDRGAPYRFRPKLM